MLHISPHLLDEKHTMEMLCLTDYANAQFKVCAFWPCDWPYRLALGKHVQRCWWANIRCQCRPTPSNADKWRGLYPLADASLAVHTVSIITSACIVVYSSRIQIDSAPRYVHVHMTYLNHSIYKQENGVLGVVRNVMYKEFLFRVRAKTETYQSVTKVCIIFTIFLTVVIVVTEAHSFSIGG